MTLIIRNKFFLLFLCFQVFYGCDFDLPESKILRNCVKPQSIVSTEQENSTIYSFDLNGEKIEDISEIIWTYKRSGGEEIAVSGTKLSNITIDFEEPGTFDIKAVVETLCEESIELRSSVTIARLCKSPTGISIIPSEEENTYTFSLDEVVVSDLSKIHWSYIKNGEEEIVVSDTNALVNIRLEGAGDYEVKAIVTTECGESTELRVPLKIDRNCVNPNSLTTIPSSENNVYSFVLNGAVPADIRSVNWTYSLNGGGEVIIPNQGVPSKIDFFFGIFGNYTIKAVIESACDEIVTLSTTVKIDRQCVLPTGITSQVTSNPNVFTFGLSNAVQGDISNIRWSYTKNSSNEIVLSTTAPTTTINFGGQGSYEVKAVITTECGETVAVSSVVVIERPCEQPTSISVRALSADNVYQFSLNNVVLSDIQRITWAYRINGTTFSIPESGSLATTINVDFNERATESGNYSIVAEIQSQCNTQVTLINVFSIILESDKGMSLFSTAGGSGSDEGTSVAIDDVGNVYVTGSFSGNSLFRNTTVSSSGGADVFVAKYNQSGTLIWIRTGGGQSDDKGQSIAVDNLGNVYVTGFFNNAARFGNVNITSRGTRDVFTMKYNTNGVLQWIRTSGGSDNDVGNSIELDSDGNVYVAGDFIGSANFGSFTLSSRGQQDAFMAKYSTNGEIQWIRSGGGSGFDSGFSLAIDDQGNPILLGHYNGTATFDNLNMNSQGEFDVFIVKYNSNGEAVWLRSGGGTSSDFGISIDTDAFGDIYILGEYDQSATFSNRRIVSNGGADIFIAKFSSGGTLEWLQTEGGPNNEGGRGLVVDNFGAVYITGRYSSLATFGSTTISSTGAAFVAKYNTNGSFEWVKSATNLSGLAIALDQTRNVYVTGTFTGNAVLLGNSSVNSRGGSDMFILKIEQ